MKNHIFSKLSKYNSNPSSLLQSLHSDLLHILPFPELTGLGLSKLPVFVSCNRHKSSLEAKEATSSFMQSCYQKNPLRGRVEMNLVLI